jgi:hypothetical protein
MEEAAAVASHSKRQTLIAYSLHVLQIREIAAEVNG